MEEKKIDTKEKKIDTKTGDPKDPRGPKQPKDQKNPRDSKGGSNGKNNSRKGSRGGRNPETPQPKPCVSRNGVKIVSNSTNDPKIYIPEGVEASTFATLSINQRLGSSLDRIAGQFANTEDMSTIPGVMALYTNRTMTNLDAMKKASLSLFSDVLTKNSSNTPFEHTDFFMHLLAISELDSLIMFIARALGVLHTYPVYNPYFINGIGAAMGISDLHTTVASDPLKYISRLNVLISRRNRFAIPKNFGYNERGIWVNAHIFADGDNLNRSQLYIPVMQSYGIWSPRSSSKGSEITYDPIITFAMNNVVELKPMETWYKALDKMLSVLEMDQDIANMQGYLRKRYEESTLQYVAPIATDYKTEVEFDLIALETICNITPVSLHTTGVDGKVIGQTGAPSNKLSQDSLNFTNTVIKGAAVAGDINTTSALLNCTTPDPSPERILDITRWVVVGKPTTDNLVKPINETLIQRFIGESTTPDPDFMLPHDVVGNIVIVTYQPSSGNAFCHHIPASQWNIDLMKGNIVTLGSLVQYFDFHPRALIWQSASNADMIDEKIFGYMGDLDCFTFVNMDWLNNVNYIATFGIYNIKTK